MNAGKRAWFGWMKGEAKRLNSQIAVSSFVDERIRWFCELLLLLSLEYILTDAKKVFRRGKVSALIGIWQAMSL